MAESFNLAIRNGTVVTASDTEVDPDLGPGASTTLALRGTR